MDLADLQRHWDMFGRQDPFWAILTDPGKRGNRWSPAEFFETGRVEVEELLDRAARLGVPARRGRALDFGCGAGRLTQALADHFEAAVGVDVAPSMIALARTHNRHGGRCIYEVNEGPDLARWPDASFDLIYTSRVLQHVEPRYATSYVREFVRLLAPKGFLSFDLPSASGDAAALADGVVPSSAMRARVVLIPLAAVTVVAGATLHLQVEVTNQSDLPWHDAPGRALNVGNHWLAADGTLLQQDDVRVKLPVPLAPGATVRLELTANAPEAPGAYRLQVDVVQEGVAWFASCGSTPAESPVRVLRSGRATSPGAPDPGAGHAGSPDVPDRGSGRAGCGAEGEPIMEMHAIPRDEVEAMLVEAGARLLDVRRVFHCGPQWLAYRYDVTAQQVRNNRDRSSFE
jgi:SAM-dependent methyltransferase